MQREKARDGHALVLPGLAWCPEAVSGPISSWTITGKFRHPVHALSCWHLAADICIPSPFFCRHIPLLTSCGPSGAEPTTATGTGTGPRLANQDASLFGTTVTGSTTGP